ncbi:hypothetical protein HBH56_068400 [Parastagonospora nodorum]|uniref:Uncharacterized protein n=1 Tax=Phaeosphaeria nodorum (strain SN15 / ATCC MYA-4574 / FGSC 10173) TaxID=321614 RepID=A0A7U2EV07_PHANO|nr:hypothetical protein HBH56_068400 [Parastagonospora nodorum]QRC93504.1 hypothetical protein JI435_429300 [Parastagonospora nodorum SN15]KAH4165694.1 hypothetical protein HBH44_068630 [Parastagonospora nodorum]KAH5331737.1 hypothetical protein HBI50_058910 [Parastagonospora nodorum]KAH5511512.1 hypothetical protein HBI31_027570 [Parastagonospora nodorum]
MMPSRVLMTGFQIHVYSTSSLSTRGSYNSSDVPSNNSSTQEAHPSNPYIQAFPPHELNVCTNLNFPPSTLKS